MDNPSNKDSFLNLVKENGMIFTEPEGYDEVPIIKQEDVSYSYALLHRNIKLEIRYQIFPMKIFREQKMSLVNFYPKWTLTACLNIAGDGDKIFNTADFTEDEVKSEFNGSAGSITNIIPDSEFGKGYNHVMAVGIVKENTAIAYMFYLCDDLLAVMPEIGPVFYNLKFKGE